MSNVKECIDRPKTIKVATGPDTYVLLECDEYGCADPKAYKEATAWVKDWLDSLGDPIPTNDGNEGFVLDDPMTIANNHSHLRVISDNR